MVRRAERKGVGMVLGGVKCHSGRFNSQPIKLIMLLLCCCNEILQQYITAQQASRYVSPPSPLAPQRQYISPCARGLRQRRGNKIRMMPLRPSMSRKVICQPGEFAVLQKCNKEHSFNLMGAKCILLVCNSNDCLSRVMELKVWRHHTDMDDDSISALYVHYTMLNVHVDRTT